MKRILNIRIYFIFLIVFLIFYSNSAYAKSPSLFFSTPPVLGVQEGNRVTLDVKVQSISQSINAISGSIIFPNSLLDVVSIAKNKSIINLWTVEPKVEHNIISFEGIILNPGFQDNDGTVFSITFFAKKVGTAKLFFSQGALLANNGLGSNVLTNLNSISFKINSAQIFVDDNLLNSPTTPKLSILPVITDYSQAIVSNNAMNAYIKGKGEPNALTKISFENISIKSLGEKLISFLQTKKKKLDDVVLKNNINGDFEYQSPNNLVSGVYNATPFLFNENTHIEKQGTGIRLLISDNRIIKTLIIFINILGLLIPIVTLIVIIYFIPWYSWRRMRVIKKKLVLEEEKIELADQKIEYQNKILDKGIQQIVKDK